MRIHLGDFLFEDIELARERYEMTKKFVDHLQKQGNDKKEIAEKVKGFARHAYM